MASTSAIFYNFWLKNTKPVPADGGNLIEGEVGTPQYINPLLSQTNEIDSDLTKLIFSSLFTINSEGKLTNDIVKDYSISDDKKTYTIKIRDDIRWHDWDKTGEKLTADDVIFTVKTIQNPDYQSPLRPNLVTVDVEKIDTYTIKFSLKTPFEPFLQNLTFGILPKHIWQNISAKNLPLAVYNIKPIGSGPYKFDKIASDMKGTIVSINLVTDPDYYGKRPLISKITFKFYKDQDSLAKALNANEISATAYFSYDSMEKIKRTDLKNYSLKIPRYFTIFLNQDTAKNLSDKDVRLALNYLTDKDQIIKDVLYGNGQKIDTPIPPILSSYNNQTKVYNFDPSYANSLLDKAGWEMQDNGFRAKITRKTAKDPKTKKMVTTITDTNPLEITLTTIDSPELEHIATILQGQWQKGGVKVNTEFLSRVDVQSSIRDRDYDTLLFGETLGLDPDPFIFWHSSETKDPGLNLSLYSNKDVDDMLENYRQTFDANQKNDILAKFQAEVVDDAPAIFLINPYINYAVADSIKGVDSKIITMPADRFAGIANWYITTKRVWKK